MNVNDLFPSRFLKAHDLGGKAFTLTIRDVTLEDVGHGAEQERKLTLAFEKATKLMLLNRTNAMIIASMYGPETDAWLGKAVTVYSARIKAFGAWHDALRIKEQIPARNVGAAQMTEAMQEDPPLDDENDLLDIDEGDELDAPRVDPDTGEIVNGDVLFEQAKPGVGKPNVLSDAQLTRLNVLGSDLYGKGWDDQRHILVDFVSKGAVSSSKELTPREADKLIAGIVAKLKAREAEQQPA